MHKLLEYNGVGTILAQKAGTAEDLGGGADDFVEGDGNVEETDDADAEDADADQGAEEDDDEGSDEEEGVGLGDRAKKRIDKLLSRSKAAEAQVEQLKKDLDAARKLGGDDGKLYVAAAEKAGILAGLMSKEEAQAFSDLEDLPVVVKRYRKWMNSHDKGDELELAGGKTMSYGDVVDRVDELNDMIEDLKEKYGERRKELQANVKELFELGVAAKKAGWSPVERKRPSEPKKRERPEGGEGRRPASRGARVDDIDVTDGDSLEAYMAAMRRRNKKED